MLHNQLYITFCAFKHFKIKKKILRCRDLRMLTSKNIHFRNQNASRCRRDRCLRQRISIFNWKRLKIQNHLANETQMAKGRMRWLHFIFRCSGFSLFNNNGTIFRESRNLFLLFFITTASFLLFFSESLIRITSFECLYFLGRIEYVRIFSM